MPRGLVPSSHRTTLLVPDESSNRKGSSQCSKFPIWAAGQLDLSGFTCVGRDVARWCRCGLSVPALSFAGASLASPCFRFHIPLIEPDGLFQASGSRRKCHDVAHGKLLVLLVRQTRPSTSCRDVSGNRLAAGHPSLCLAHNH